MNPKKIEKQLDELKHPEINMSLLALGMIGNIKK